MKTTLAKAVALAATMGAAASAHAVNVDPNGLGQVLLYPVYTADNGNYTAIHVTNTTNQTKAVKVRFVEGMNSAEVLDFNLYLSPEDVWTGVVERTATGARLKTSDTSCTVGTIGTAGVAFRDFVYAADSVKGTERARVGHVEVIEMGVVETSAISEVRALADAIKHGSNGVPANCAAVTARFTGGNTNWTPGNNALGAPTGGLYGSANIVNVDAGTEIGFDAVAVDNFNTLQSHSRPGDTLPNLGQAQLFATYPDGKSANFPNGRGLDSISSVLSKTTIANDYAVGAGLNAQTDWVVTFPTKRAYVNNGVSGTPAVPNAATPPFVAGWNPATSEACEPVTISYWDREELPGTVESDDFSPQPEAEGVSLCYETNIVGFSSNGMDSNLLGGTGFVRREVDLKGHQAGWARIGLQATPASNLLTAPGFDENGTAGTITVSGLPVIGFGMTAIQNGDVGGLLSNYAGAWVHKANTEVTFTP